MSGYTPLTREQRYQIQALMKTGQNQTQMATVLDVHKATISRELRRNRGLRGYRPHQAQQLAQARQARNPRTRLSPRVWQQVETLVRQAWSPEQIRGRLKREHGRTISHEWLYQYIYRDKHAGVRSTARCAVRRHGGSAMVRIVAAGVSPIKSLLTNGRPSWRLASALGIGKALR